MSVRKKATAVPGKHTKCQFANKQDVLIRWKDGLFYLGNVIQVDYTNNRCFVRFEDDSQHWAMFKDISKAASNGEISCCICREDLSERPNEIVLCDNCGLGYHQKCHMPQIEASVLKPDVEWLCRLCVFATTVRRGGALNNGSNAEALKIMKQTLPYKMKSLTWDAHHKTNLEHSYCYCGGPGEWYQKMLQCCRCKQWFHEACLQCLDFPLFLGDRWYIFACSVCNFGEEYAKHLEFRWVDIAQLALFNLSVICNRKYFDVNEVVIPWVKDNWDALQSSLPKSSIKEAISHQLDTNQYRFVSGKEIKKKFSLFGLRVRLPPPPPTVFVPDKLLISDDVIDSIKLKGYGKRSSFSPVPKKKRKEMMDHVTSPSASAKKFLKTSGSMTDVKAKPSSPDQNYKGQTSQVANGISPPDKRKPKCSLDSIIPRLHSYAGHNHPFKTELEQNAELEKQRTLQLYQNGYDTDSTSQSSMTEDTDKEQSDNNQSSVTNGYRVRRKHQRKIGHRISGGAISPVEVELLREIDSPASFTALGEKCAATKSFKSHGVVDTAAIEAVKSKEVSVERLKSSVCHYFGTSERLAQGEPFQVVARRVTPDNKVQYLLEWEGLLG